jgi:hypothetical protein
MVPTFSEKHVQPLTRQAIAFTCNLAVDRGQDLPVIRTIMDACKAFPGVDLPTLAAAFGFVADADDSLEEDAFWRVTDDVLEELDLRRGVVRSVEAWQLLCEFLGLSGCNPPRCELIFPDRTGEPVGTGAA